MKRKWKFRTKRNENTRYGTHEHWSKPLTLSARSLEHQWFTLWYSLSYWFWEYLFRYLEPKILGAWCVKQPWNPANRCRLGNVVFAVFLWRLPLKLWCLTTSRHTARRLTFLSSVEWTTALLLSGGITHFTSTWQGIKVEYKGFVDGPVSDLENITDVSENILPALNLEPESHTNGPDNCNRQWFIL